MHIKRLYSVSIIMIFLISSLVLVISSSSQNNELTTWNRDWSYNQELFLPISTDSPHAIFQPIDIKMKFDHSCWAKNENEHSVRVVCWDGNLWHELESQIYNLEFTNVDHINSCNLVFLVPELANGKERYFIYYDDAEKPSPNYVDHVEIEDAYYYYELISGITAEGDLYKIIDDGYVVYGVGQKGTVVDQKLSQCIISEKPEMKDFNAVNVYHIAGFGMSYSKGPTDEDDIYSIEKLVSKCILNNGNLMVEFGIVSESNDGKIRSSNIYKYYHCPNNKKRINVHVKHEHLTEGIVSGNLNVDGRYGSLMSYKSRSERLHRMRFGEILPYLHVYGERDDILEYKINVNPESREDEWVVPYEDDCDLGKNAWFSYDEGNTGKSHAVIFSSVKNVVKKGTDERDGIQLKVAEREFLDLIGAEIDYAIISFGRNSYERGGSHDLHIPDDLVVEYDAEVFTYDNGGYTNIEDEAKIYQTLVKYRQNSEDDLFEGDKKIHTLTVTPRFTGRLFSHPFFRNITGFSISNIWAELYKDDELVSISYTNKPLFGPPNIKFPKLAAGDYIVKVYRKFLNFNKSYIGIDKVTVTEDTKLNIFCTWQKSIDIKCFNQNEKGIEGIELILLKNDTIVASNITDKSGILRLFAPFNLFDEYLLQAYYKGFLVYNKEIPMLKNKIKMDIDLYDITVNVKDRLGMPPGVDVRPFITSSKMYDQIDIKPETINEGVYLFKNLPTATYNFQISYGVYKDIKKIKIPRDSDPVYVDFSALFDLDLDLYDSQGNLIHDDDKKIEIKRNGQIVYDSTNIDNTITLPPGKYTINVYSNEKHIGFKNIELTNNKKVKIVTVIKPILPSLIIGVVIVFIIEIVILLLIKRISINTFLKLLAMSLILISLFLPWWTLYASSDTPAAEKSTEMYIFPQTMIETLEYKDVKYLDLATIPEVFTDFVGILMIIICSGFVLLGISFIPNIILKRRFYKVLIFSSVLFLILVAIAFSYGMSTICEISVGSLQGEGTLDVQLPDNSRAFMNANWGLGPGFYLCIIAALITIGAGIIDSLRKKELPKFLRKK